eukprot:2629402-Pyramimonas_sp.AAC.1
MTKYDCFRFVFYILSPGRICLASGTDHAYQAFVFGMVSEVQEADEASAVAAGVTSAHLEVTPTNPGAACCGLHEHRTVGRDARLALR